MMAQDASTDHADAADQGDQLNRAERRALRYRAVMLGHITREVERGAAWTRNTDTRRAGRRGRRGAR